MGFQIEDGKGTGKRAQVFDDNRLAVRAVVRGEPADATEVYSASWNVGKSTVTTLTSANASAMLYMKNNTNADWSIDAIFCFLGASTGGAGEWVATVYRNPTGGTIVSTATAANVQNRNFKSSNIPTADFFTGVEGATLVGTIFFIDLFTSTANRISFDGNLVIPPGHSVGVSLTPPTGNTSADVVVSAAFHDVEVI